MDGKIHGKQIKDTSVDLLKLDLSGAQGTFLLGTGSYFGTYEVPNDPLAYVNKQYADSLSSGLDPKESVYLVAVSDITTNGTQSIDGVTASVGSRVLLTGQSSAVDNGIYVVGVTAWSRASDANGDPSNEVSLGNYTFTERGVTYSSTGWVLYDTDAVGATVSPGVNTQLWTQFNGAGSFLWGDGLSNTGNNIFVDFDPQGGLTFSSTKLKIADYVAGNGLTINSGVLNVGAADGITVGADTVGINYTEAAVGLEGNGLTASGGKISVGGGTAIGINSDSVYVKYDPTTIAIDGNGALTVISAGDAIVDIVAGRGISGNQLSGPTASLDAELTDNGGLTFSGAGAGATIQVDYTPVASQLAGNGLINNGITIDINATNGLTVSGDSIQINQSAAGNGLTFSGGVFGVNVANGLTINSDNVEVASSIAGNGLTFSGGVVDINVVKGVTFSGDALFADAGTINTTANLPTLGVGTNSSVQSALTAIDTKLATVGAQEMLAISNVPSGIFPKAINSPQDVLGGYTFSTASDGIPQIFINGAYVKPVSATVSTGAYFSTNGGSVGTFTVEVGSVLYLNPNILGYRIDTGDVITVNYLTRVS